MYITHLPIYLDSKLGSFVSKDEGGGRSFMGLPVDFGQPYFLD